MQVLALLGLFTDRNDRFPTLSYTSTNEITTLSYSSKPEIGTPFGWSLSVEAIMPSPPGFEARYKCHFPFNNAFVRLVTVLFLPFLAYASFRCGVNVSRLFLGERQKWNLGW